MFFLTIKLDRVSFETKGREDLQKTADFFIESIVFCPHLRLKKEIAAAAHWSINIVSIT